MAISGGDGSIILTTKVDTSGINKGMSSIKGTISKIGASLAVAFSVTTLINFGKQAIQLASDLEEVQNVVDTAFGNMAYKMEEFANTAIETYGISELTAKRTASTYMAMAKGMGIAEDAGSDMALTLTGLTADMASFYNVSQEMADTAVKSVFTGETESLKQYGIVMTEVNLEQFALSQGITKSLSAMTQQEKTMLRYNYVLQQTALAQGDFVRTQDSWANKTRVLNERWKEMQTTFGEVFIAIGVLVLPVIEAIVNGLQQIALMVKTVAGMLGLFKEEANETAKATSVQVGGSQQTADNIGEQVKNQKALNKEMKKTVAGFDDLQILSGGASGGGAGTGTEDALGGISTGGAIGGVGGGLDGTVEEISSTMTLIMGIIGESLIAVGILLLFFGHIGWGIGFIIAGASIFMVSVASASAFDMNGIVSMLTTIMGIAGGALLALGIILLWLGGVVGKGVAIGMIIAGGALIVSAVATKAAFAPDDIKGWLATILGIAAGALLALGVILCMVGSVAHGVAMIIAGSASLITAAVLNYDAITNSVTEFFKENAGLIVGVSLALLVLGIILICTGVGIPLGIGLILVGAAGLATEVALNWNFIKDKAVEVFNNIMDWVKTWGLLILGIILVVSGVGMPLGLALIKKAGANLTEAQDPLWTAIVDKVKETWEAIKLYWNTHIAKWFTKEHWAGLAKNMMNGLIEKIEEGLNKILKKFHEKNIGKAIDFIAGGLGFEIPTSITLPRLAKGAVIPPNREFLAVLGDQKHGTNIEAPLQTIVDAFNIALQGNANYGGGNTEVVLEIDGREFGRAVVEQGNRENRRIGTKLVIA